MKIKKSRKIHQKKQSKIAAINAGGLDLEDLADKIVTEDEIIVHWNSWWAQSVKQIPSISSGK